MDWRGQGHSSRQLPDPRKGHVERFSDFELDLETFMQRVVRPNCPPPYYALAHSMGGAVLLRAAHAGSAGSSAWCWSRRCSICRGARLLVIARADQVARRAGFGDAYVPGSNVDRSRARGFPGNPLTTDPARYARNAALIAADPTLALGSPTFAWLDATFDTVVEFRDPDYPSQIEEPVLMVAAGADTIVSEAGSSDLPRDCRRERIGVIEGARHEILQEQDAYRAQFWAAFDAFVAGRSVQLGA